VNSEAAVAQGFGFGHCETKFGDGHAVLFECIARFSLSHSFVIESQSIRMGNK
jgi:hypothetical protein